VLPPPLFAAGQGKNCIITVRIEDGRLDEILPTLDTVLLGKGQRLSLTLPSGSVILIGSATHLARVGVEAYTLELTRTEEAVAARAGGGVHVIPAITLPASGYNRGDLIRQLADLDSWAVTVAPTENISLAAARSEIWNILKKLGHGRNDSNKVKGLQMPIGFRNTRRGTFTAGIIENLPNRVDVLDPECEEAALRKLAAALNQHYCLGLDEEVTTQRGAGASSSGTTGRVAIIGASHARKYAASDALRTCNVVKDLPHWTPTELHTAATCKKLKDLKLGKDDCVILDLFSNSTYMGTDNRGLPNLPFQDEEGRYHIEGQLDVAPLRALGFRGGNATRGRGWQHQLPDAGPYSGRRYNPY
jgi:hypothetical protein